MEPSTFVNISQRENSAAVHSMVTGLLSHYSEGRENKATNTVTERKAIVIIAMTFMDRPSEIDLTSGNLVME